MRVESMTVFGKVATMATTTISQMQMSQPINVKKRYAIQWKQLKSHKPSGVQLIPSCWCCWWWFVPYARWLVYPVCHRLVSLSISIFLSLSLFWSACSFCFAYKKINKVLPLSLVWRLPEFCSQLKWFCGLHLFQAEVLKALLLLVCDLKQTCLLVWNILCA